MPTSNRVQQIIRQRMTATGENYTTARRAVLAGEHESVPPAGDSALIVTFSADPSSDTPAEDILYALEACETILDDHALSYDVRAIDGHDAHVAFTRSDGAELTASDLDPALAAACEPLSRYDLDYVVPGGESQELRHNA